MTPRAIVFDLDDTLYRERRFVLSGYRAVALAIERDLRVSASQVFRVLSLALRRGRRSRAFQDLAASLGVPESKVPAWVEQYRAHEPALRLLPAVTRTLDRMRGEWRVGVLTNGIPSVQAAKVRALGLGDLVDAVTYADEFGGGKPSAAAFFEILSRLGAEARCAVFAGDDPLRDIEGARRIGMKTVFVTRREDLATLVPADAVVRRVSDVPAAAERLLSGESGHAH
jgi:putative hydrolase of the HAD superfamily